MFHFSLHKLPGERRKEIYILLGEDALYPIIIVFWHTRVRDLNDDSLVQGDISLSDARNTNERISRLVSSQPIEKLPPYCAKAIPFSWF